MKTAMQELKEEIQSKVFPPTYNDGNLTDYQYGHNVAYGVVLTIVEYLIEKEKEQIMDAMEKTAMYVSAASLDKEIGKMTFEDLYNQIFNQNK